jgi:hypothetical protein
MTPRAREHRFRRLKEMGCIACFLSGTPDVYPEIQHLNLGSHAGQKQLGDEFTIPLCKWHHQAHRIHETRDSKWHEAIFGPSLKSARKFHARYGSDATLLAKVNDLIRQMDDVAYGHLTEAERLT